MLPAAGVRAGRRRGGRRARRRAALPGRAHRPPAGGAGAAGRLLVACPAGGAGLEPRQERGVTGGHAGVAAETTQALSWPPPAAVPEAGCGRLRTEQGGGVGGSRAPTCAIICSCSNCLVLSWSAPPPWLPVGANGAAPLSALSACLGGRAVSTCTAPAGGGCARGGHHLHAVEPRGAQAGQRAGGSPGHGRGGPPRARLARSSGLGPIARHRVLALHLGPVYLHPELQFVTGRPRRQPGSTLLGMLCNECGQ